MERSETTCSNTRVSEGKLIDYYVDLHDTTTGDLKLLRAALEERAGKRRMHWPLQEASANAAKGKVKGSDFASSLKQLFKSAFPAEAMTSSVLLQRILTGLHPDINHQLLLRTRPTTFTAAVKDATDVEYTCTPWYLGKRKVGIHAIRPTQPTPNCPMLLHCTRTWMP